jgi:hypothetical protein
MEQRKTNESVKAGLQPGVTGKEVENKEIDVDDVIHQPDFEPTALFNKIDNTGLQTNSTQPPAENDNEERDPDDQVHGK